MMRLSRLEGRLPRFGPESLPDSAGGRAEERAFLSLMALVLIFAWMFAFDDRFLQILRSVYALFEATWRRIWTLTPWQRFLLFAPALLLDSTRYYLMNALVILRHLILGEDYAKAPQIFDSPETAPLVSAVIPVHNQERFTRHTLDTLLENSYPNLEIIVVDDGSRDGTSLICEEYARAGLIRYVKQEINCGKPAALNAGFRVARGEYILHIDGDTVLWQDAICELLKPFRDPRVGAVCGNLRVLNDLESFWTGFQSFEYGMTINVHRRFLSYANILEIVSGAFGAYRREVLTAVKGADTETGEDLDLTLKTRKMGYRIAFAPRAIALTEVPARISGLWRQRIFWERCYIRINLRKHGDLFRVSIYRLTNFFMMLLDAVYNIALLLIYPAYLLIIALFFKHLLVFVALATFLFYQIITLIQVGFCLALSQRRLRDLQFLLYTPFYFLYVSFLRITRASAYFLELVRSPRFKRGHMPPKVWAKMPEHELASHWRG